MNIINLNEDAQILLFQKFTLQEQMRLRAVCTSWNQTITKMCRPKKSLKLFGPSRDADFYKTFVNRFNLFSDPDFELTNLLDSSLIIYGQHRASSHFLARLFPNVERLLLYTDSNWIQIDLSYLLSSCWQKTLKSLTLFRMECFLEDHLRGRCFWIGMNY